MAERGVYLIRLSVGPRSPCKWLGPGAQRGPDRYPRRAVRIAYACELWRCLGRARGRMTFAWRSSPLVTRRRSEVAFSEHLSSLTSPWARICVPRIRGPRKAAEYAKEPLPSGSMTAPWASRPELSFVAAFCLPAPVISQAVDCINGCVRLGFAAPSIADAPYRAD